MRILNGVVLLLTVLVSSSRAAEFRLMSPERDRAHRALLPRIEDSRIEQILGDPNTILFTDAEMPRAYQFRGGIHSPSYNISAGTSENSKGPGRGGNANIEFPWLNPAGTDLCQNVATFKFLHLPRSDSGRAWPVVWYQSNFADEDGAAYAWIYPIGTTVGEVLYMIEDGAAYVFEIRTRTRMSNRWAVEVYRPFPTASSLAARLEELAPDMTPSSAEFKMVSFLNERRGFTLLQLADNQPDQGVFRQQAFVDRLPPLPKEMVKTLLQTTPFKSSAGEQWNDVQPQDAWVHAPASNEAFHIIPKGFQAAFLEVSAESCLRCHRSTNMPARAFNRSRDWYGRVRGSDGIFSFHPFEPARISYNGFSQGIALRQSLIDAGILEHYDRSRHPAERYSSLPGLTE